jgi:hypothetical protein
MQIIFVITLYVPAPLIPYFPLATSDSRVSVVAAEISGFSVISDRPSCVSDFRDNP